MPDEGVYLQGGPCDGNYVILGYSSTPPSSTTCNGNLYKVTNPAQYHAGVLVFKNAGKVPAPKPVRVAPQALKGWGALQKSLSREMPRALAHSQHLTAAALRTLHRARKVRV